MPALARATRHPYGAQHQRDRAAAVRAALGTRCPAAWSRNCDGVMVNPTRMHYDHTTPLALGGTRADRVICMPCNTGMGAALGNRLRGAKPHGTRQTARRLPTW